jgi:hypothetical protein
MIINIYYLYVFYEEVYDYQKDGFLINTIDTNNITPEAYTEHNIVYSITDAFKFANLEYALDTAEKLRKIDFKVLVLQVKEVKE